MVIKQTYILLQHAQKRNGLILVVLLFFVLATISLDFLFAKVQNSSFYLSESLLFCTYWLVFVPIIRTQWKLLTFIHKPVMGLLYVVLATVIHLLCYPALVWLLSKFFYYHTFSYKQTFYFGWTTYFTETIIVYGLSLPLLVVGKGRFLKQTIVTEKQGCEAPLQSFATSLIVSDSNNRKAKLQTMDILYFSANSPYINIHLTSKKYLYTQTLKSLESTLDNNQFVRIHKSYIVNIGKVVSYQSRLNGDYDLTLTDNTLLRVSRNYAAIFKAKLENGHHLTTK